MAVIWSYIFLDFFVDLYFFSLVYVSRFVANAFFYEIRSEFWSDLSDAVLSPCRVEFVDMAVIGYGTNEIRVDDLFDCKLSQLHHAFSVPYSVHCSMFMMSIT